MIESNYGCEVLVMMDWVSMVFYVQYIYSIFSVSIYKRLVSSLVRMNDDALSISGSEKHLFCLRLQGNTSNTMNWFFLDFFVSHA